MEQNKRENRSIISKIHDVAEPFCLSENFELVNVECLGSSGSLLVRLSIDKPGGITIDDCVYVTRQMGDLIDVHLEDLGPYRLEVSSPGPNRPLTKESDFQRFKGEKVRLELKEAVKGRRRFAGINKGITNHVVALSVDRETVELQYELIRKARLAGTHGEL